jgi:hypothetical protein
MQTRNKKPSTEINNVKRATPKMVAAYIKLFDVVFAHQAIWSDTS